MLLPGQVLNLGLQRWRRRHPSGAQRRSRASRDSFVSNSDVYGSNAPLVRLQLDGGSTWRSHWPENDNKPTRSLRLLEIWTEWRNFLQENTSDRAWLSHVRQLCVDFPPPPFYLDFIQSSSFYSTVLTDLWSLCDHYIFFSFPFCCTILSLSIYIPLFSFLFFFTFLYCCVVYGSCWIWDALCAAWFLALLGKWDMMTIGWLVGWKGIWLQGILNILGGETSPPCVLFVGGKPNEAKQDNREGIMNGLGYGYGRIGYMGILPWFIFFFLFIPSLVLCLSFFSLSLFS